MSRLWLQIIVIVSLVSAVYMHAPQAGFIPIDDGSLTFKNPLVTEISLDSLKGVFSTYDPELYVPLTLISYQIDYFFAGENPAIFHSTNLLLHILNSILVLFLLRKLTKNSWVPFLTACLFAVHPLNTEAVMWISGRKDLLSALFFLSSLILYIQYKTKDTRLPYYVSIFLFALALMSKVVTATLPLTFIIIDDVLKQKSNKHDQLRKLPYYLLSIAFLYIGMFGKSLTVYFLSYFETFLLAGKSAGFYIQKLLLPFHVMPLYQQDLPIEPFSLEFITPFAILILLYIIAIASRSIHRAISFGILWYGITLLPSLANFARGEGWSIFYASDRYAYLPSIGILLMMSFAIVHLQKKWMQITAATLVTILFSCGAFVQSQRWLTGEILFSYVVERAPQTHLAHALLGILDMEKDNYPEAIEHLQVSSSLAPAFPDGRAHLGLALIKNNQIDDGIRELEKTTQLNADYVPAYVYIAYGKILQGKTSEAIATLDRILQLEPTNAKAYQLLGSIAQQNGDAALATKHYMRSLELNPRSTRTMAAFARLKLQK